MTDKKKQGDSEELTARPLQSLVKRYILDLSNVKPGDLPERFKNGPMQIPMVEGHYENEYDVVMDELPPEIAEKWKKYSIAKKPAMRQDWPLGVSSHHLDRCRGAVILDA